MNVKFQDSVAFPSGSGNIYLDFIELEELGGESLDEFFWGGIGLSGLASNLEPEGVKG